jgi:TonB family protein
MKEASMFKKKIILIGIAIFFLSGSAFTLDYELEMKARFYEGTREGETESFESVTSSYLQPTVTATIPARFLLSEEKAQISRVFNLKEVDLITEADLRWKAKKGSLSHLFRLDGKTYRMEISVVSREEKVSTKSNDQELVHQFAIGIFEQANGEEMHLMDTDITLPQTKMVVIGFEDKDGKPYFLSFHVTSVTGTPPPPPPPPPAPSVQAPPPPPPLASEKEVRQAEQKIEEFERGSVKVEGEIKPPKLIKKVEPVYPEEARQARVEGTVILGVRTDLQGRVSRVLMYSSKDPLLVKPAMDAVKQWVYEPLFIEGKPVEAVFTVHVTFKLKQKKMEKEEAIGGIVGGVLQLGDSAKTPKLVKKVDPIYPEEAKKALVQGVVVLEVTTDSQGNVADVRVLESESSLLNQSAIDAVGQWKYEVMYNKGKPIPVSFKVTVTYKLR